MAEESERPPADPAATAFALGAVNDPAMREEVRAYLKRQAELAALQIEDLKREDAVRHWSLRVRHISDVLKLGFELAAAAIVTAVAVFVGGAVWMAAHDRALVIESFAVPADMAANGLSGEVIAKQVQDRLAWMQDHTDTIRQAGTYRNSFGGDVKVQIPDTGVSVGELYTYLVNWLGHQTHITGEVWRGANGVSLSVRSGAGAAAVFAGPAGDLSPLIGQAAERIYWQTQPYRYVVFLDETGRIADCRKFSWMLALHGEESERAWAYARLALSASEDGDFENFLRYGHRAAALNPRLAHVWSNIAAADVMFGHDEDGLQDNRKAFALLSDPEAARQLAAYAVKDDLLVDKAMISEMLGDYADAIPRERTLETMPVYSGSDLSSQMMVAGDMVLDHDLSGPPVPARTMLMSLNALATQQYSSDYPPLPDYERAAATGDWQGARAEMSELLRLPDAHAKGVRWIVPVLLVPKLARADAMLGDTQAADALIAGTPRDCYLCMRVRGQIAAQARRWRDAEAAFAAAVKLGPSLPFADFEWGQMKLSKGDLAGAVAQFEAAHEKGPHFADPLEAWGEVLMAQNRSDLALAKFEEAAKYAPKWKRLHRKWAEALLYAGRPDDAKAQRSIAASLPL
jgi:tetratricopeptide (TPR) repeat protein